MKYLIMCGGPSCKWDLPKQLYEIDGKPLIRRTVELLKAAGAEDIYITSTNKVFSKYATLLYYNSNKEPYSWLDCFYLMPEPVCYIFGDVLFSPEAIRTIVEKDTESIDFFASGHPFSPRYGKQYAEPFAFKVRAHERFKAAVERAKWLGANGCFSRDPIAWELWQVIQGTPLNIIAQDYTIINDYTRDFDSEEEFKEWLKHQRDRMPLSKETETK